jgi:hypothetical protein
MLTHGNMRSQIDNFPFFLEVKPGDSALSLLPPWWVPAGAGGAAGRAPRGPPVACAVCCVGGSVQMGPSRRGGLKPRTDWHSPLTASLSSSPLKPPLDAPPPLPGTSTSARPRCTWRPAAPPAPTPPSCASGRTSPRSGPTTLCACRWCWSCCTQRWAGKGARQGAALTRPRGARRARARHAAHTHTQAPGRALPAGHGQAAV